MNKLLCTALLTALAAVMIYSAVNIVLTEKDYMKSEKIYEKSRAENFHVSEEEQEAISSDESEVHFPDVFVDFNALKETNPDIVGWLWIPGTELSYPLLRAENNSKYLNLSYDLQSTNSGGIFMDCRNSPDFTDGNTVIYGHNMKSGGMFGTLKDFSDIDYLRENTDLYIFTETEVFKYRIFAAYKTEADSLSYTRSFSDKFCFEDLIGYIKSSAGENICRAPGEASVLVTLSTCTSARRTERFVVHACLVASKITDGTSLNNKTE